jgi:hypothetical protein
MLFPNSGAHNGYEVGELGALTKESGLKNSEVDLNSEILFPDSGAHNGYEVGGLGALAKDSGLKNSEVSYMLGSSHSLESMVLSS